jgi:hypothetical protein
MLQRKERRGLRKAATVEPRRSVRRLPPGHEGLRVDGTGSFVDNPALTPAHGRAGDGKDSSDHVSGHR